MPTQELSRRYMKPGEPTLCHICHTPLREGAVFCHNCGIRIPSQVILKAIALLSTYPNISWQVTESGLNVEASSPEGFPIFVEPSDLKTVLWFGGMHYSFDDPIVAFDYFQKAISGQARIAETSRCGITYRWAIQELDQTGVWTDRFITASLIPMILPKKRTRYFSNRFIRIEIPDDRPLTEDERALVEWMLDNGDAEDYILRSSVTFARVVRKCGCGCASVDFTINGTESPRNLGIHPLVDYVWPTEKGNLCGCFLFTRGDQLAGLEVWSIDGQEMPTRLPRPEELKSWEEFGAA